MITPEIRREWRGFQMAMIAWVVLACMVVKANNYLVW
jgi:hypothetical protein